MKYKSFIFSFFLISSSLVSYGYTFTKKVNFVIYILEGKEFGDKEKIFLKNFFESKSENEKFILTSIVNHNNIPKIIHFNDYKELSASKVFLQDSIYKYSLEYPLKNNFKDIDAVKLDLLNEIKDIFEIYNLNKTDFTVEFCNVLDVSNPLKLLDNNLMIIYLLNEIRLLSLVKEENSSTEFIINEFESLQNNNQKVSTGIQFINKKNKYEIQFK